MPLMSGGLMSSVRAPSMDIYRTTVRGMARRGALAPAPNGSATGTGDNSTLQQRRHTGKMPFSTSALRMPTYFSPFHTSSSDDFVRSPTSTRMNGQKYIFPENDTRACRNGY